jgi:hypothetical protein
MRSAPHKRRSVWLALPGLLTLAEQVRRQAPCPVLTVRTPLPDMTPSSNASEEGLVQA